MKLMAIALTGALAAGAAQAQQTYSQIVETQSRCKMIGDMWRESYEFGTVMGKDLDYYLMQMVDKKITGEQYFAIAGIFHDAPHKKNFRTASDAYMAGWAQCMDKAKEAAKP